MATVLLAHFFSSFQKKRDVSCFRSSLLYMKFVFSPPLVLNVTGFHRIFSLMKKMIIFSRHCERALFSQDPSFDLKYLRLSLNFHTMRPSLFWHFTQRILPFTDVPGQSINNPTHLQESNTLCRWDR